MNRAKLRMAFLSQKHTSKRRGIAFLLTYDEWLHIWEASGHLGKRGRRRGEYCMSRPGDVGPYAVENVEIALVSKNDSDASRGKTRTEEVRKRMSAASPYRGRPIPEGKRQKLIGRVVSEETCRKLSAARMGNKHCVGRVVSEETRKKIGAANRGRVQSEAEKQKRSESGRRYFASRAA